MSQRVQFSSSTSAHFTSLRYKSTLAHVQTWNPMLRLFLLCSTAQYTSTFCNAVMLVTCCNYRRKIQLPLHRLPPSNRRRPRLPPLLCPQPRNQLFRQLFRRPMHQQARPHFPLTVLQCRLPCHPLVHLPRRLRFHPPILQPLRLLYLRQIHQLNHQRRRLQCLLQTHPLHRQLLHQPILPLTHLHSRPPTHQATLPPRLQPIHQPTHPQCRRQNLLPMRLQRIVRLLHQRLLQPMRLLSHPQMHLHSHLPTRQLHLHRNLQQLRQPTLLQCRQRTSPLFHLPPMRPLQTRHHQPSVLLYRLV
mmetsp:Transcript_18668/g.29663  ORF Transcript_18668/g.29663 Transcript_18668/m.29663 type:complete len:303 (+) Transcript_18668:364-1272(+)